MGTLYSQGPSADVLQEVNVTLMSEQYCTDNSNMHSSQLDDSMFCAGVLDNDENGLTDGGQDSCQGDSGGPLICAHNGIPYLTGVVSWGFGCADEGAPGIYGDVSVVKDWAMNYFANGLPSCKYNNTISFNPVIERDFMNSDTFTFYDSDIWIRVQNKQIFSTPENFFPSQGILNPGIDSIDVRHFLS